MIIVRSKPEAERLNLKVPHAFISITDPGVVADLQTNMFTIDVLRLQFEDRTPRTNDEIEGVYWEEKENPVLFTPDMANQIFDFVEKTKNVPDGMLVVHCHAGQSRSAGVASFLATVFDEDDKPFYEPPKTPNAHVRSVMRHVWIERTGKILI